MSNKRALRSSSSSSSRGGMSAFLEKRPPSHTATGAGMSRLTTVMRLTTVLVARSQMALTSASSQMALRAFASSSSSHSQKFTIRTATKEDIPLLDQCNRANLPENYTTQFFSDQVERWPDLCLIAETVRKKEVVGYALGRVLREQLSFFEALSEPPSYYGHVASIAINEPFRGIGASTKLMERLHSTFAEAYQLNRVDLYVRPSNQRAVAMYMDRFGYKLDRVESAYYEDREDGWRLLLTNLGQQ